MLGNNRPIPDIPKNVGELLKLTLNFSEPGRVILYYDWKHSRG